MSCKEGAGLELDRVGLWQGQIVREETEEWDGYNEIMGVRQRYRVLDLERLGWRLGRACLEEVRKNLEASLAERIAGEPMKREWYWTESLAVGSATFVERLKPGEFPRTETEILQTEAEVWALQEAAVPYGPKKGSKDAANARWSGDVGAIRLCSNQMPW